MSARRVVATVALASAAVVAGCASAPQPLYHWDGYQALVYQHLNADAVSAEDQLRALDQQAQKARGASRALPPGFRAHTGLLLLKLGREEEAFAQFREEKAVFPESARYMDFLLRRAVPAATVSSVQ